MSDFGIRKVSAPWTEEQVTKLNEFQSCRRVHPFTCGSGNRSDAAHSRAKEERGDHDWGQLIATRDGWICPACSYNQNWAWSFMARGAPPISCAETETLGGLDD